MAVPSNNSSSPVESIKANWVHVNTTSPHVDEKAFRAIDDRLHNATTPEAIIKLLNTVPNINVNSQLENGNTPLHVYVRQGDKGYPLILALISHANPDQLELDTHGEKLNTPLHTAAELNDLNAAAALIAFGANVCAINYYQQSPLDLAKNNDHYDMVDLLFSVGGELGCSVCSKFEEFVCLPHAPLGSPGTKQDCGNKEKEDQDWKLMSSQLVRSESLSRQAEESYSAWLEWRKKIKQSREKEQQAGFPIFDKKKGERVLFLDGGGMRGLIQTEVLSHLTTMTGRTIPELFDWVVGTSTGGIVALALVYGPLNTESFCIPHLRKLYFEIKDRVFGKTRFGLGCDTNALEMILKREFKDRRLTPVPQGTKVLISAVDKSNDKLEVCWFNNCLNDKYSGELLWKVGRATSAAPCYFKPMDQYIDGGLKVNNPSEGAMTVIQDHLRATDPYGDIKLVVSVGCGLFPPKPLGDVDIEKYLFFGKHWMKPWKIVENFSNLIHLLAEGINNSEAANNNTRSRCQGQGIPYYRFNPRLDDEVQLSEIDNQILIDMILKARAHISSNETRLDELIQSFYR